MPIQFVRDETDRDIIISCAQGHRSFRLIVRIRLAGAMIKRYAQCTECQEEQEID